MLILKDKFKKSKALTLVLILLLNMGLVYMADITSLAATAPTSDFQTKLDENNELTIIRYNGKSKEIEIPSTIGGKRVVSIGERAFEMEDLTNVTIPDTVTTIGLAAFAHNNLTSITIPTSVTTIGAFAFNQNQLTSLTIEDGVTTIEDLAFQNNKITSVTIPDSVTSIRRGAFKSNNLTSVTISNSLTTIESSVFSGNKLTNVTIPDSVTTIGRGAFGSNKLTNVIIGDSVTTIEMFAFANNELTNVTIPNNVNLEITAIGASFEEYYDSEGKQAGEYKFDSDKQTWTHLQADTTAPTLSAGSVNRTSDTNATVKFTSNEAGKYYYAVVADGAEAPTIDTSVEGVDCTTSETTITDLTGLTSGANDIYVVVKDADGNISSQLKIDIPAYTGNTGNTNSGDANGDGIINSSDLALLTRYLINPNENPLDANAITALDINKDGDVDSKDKVLLQRYLINPEKYPLP